ncbi:hypothetical protein GGR58DRAFT_506011 [Xylaria digitata]|nr:hypothetical protein GGR58DRAFT_506011 [Xylaria digitata]
MVSSLVASGWGDKLLSALRNTPVPPFDYIRLAVASDLERIARISVVGFKDSEIFRYERPRYEEYPEDAVASFVNIYRAQLLDPLAVVIVAQDRPNPADGDSDRSGTSGQRVVVGVASWRLPEGSPRQGQFVVPDVGDPRPTPNRDLCQHRLDLFTRITQDTENHKPKTVFNPTNVRRFFRGKGTSPERTSAISSSSIHHTAVGVTQPRCSNGDNALCDQDGIDRGVIPSYMDEQVYLGLGYKVIGEMHVPDDGIAQGFTQRVAVYSAQKEKTEG